MTTNYRKSLRLESLKFNKSDIASENAIWCRQRLQQQKPVVCSGCCQKACLTKAWRKSCSPACRESDLRDAVLHPCTPGDATIGCYVNTAVAEYCVQCKAGGAVPYQSIQFNKYYSDYPNRIKATMVTAQ